MSDFRPMHEGHPMHSPLVADPPTQWTNYAIGDLELSVRASNALRGAGYNTLYDLAITTPGQLLAIENFGSKSFREVKEMVRFLARDLERERTAQRKTYYLSKVPDRVAFQLMSAMLSGGAHSDHGYSPNYIMDVVEDLLVEFYKRKERRQTPNPLAQNGATAKKKNADDED